jgi:hypothetical protein
MRALSSSTLTANAVLFDGSPITISDALDERSQWAYSRTNKNISLTSSEIESNFSVPPSAFQALHHAKRLKSSSKETFLEHINFLSQEITANIAHDYLVL